MQRSSFRLKLFGLSLLLLLLVGPARAQTRIEPIDNLPQLNLENNEVLAQEERYGNLERLHQVIKPLPGLENRPPTFNISPDTRTIRVGEKVTFRFKFGDPDNDPYFAGVIAVTPRVKLERLFETRKERALAASIKIDVLTPDDPSVIVWEVTAQNPGVAIFFVSIAELFATNIGGQLQLSSGQLSHVAYIFRVVDDRADAAPPGFVQRLTDIKLRIGERTKLTFAAESSENRPLTYGFLFLAYASRLVRARIGPNILDLKAIEKGKGIFVAYVIDGSKADIQTFLITVADPAEPIESLLKLRALSATSAVGSSKPIELDLYGDNFTPASRVILSTTDGEQQLPASFVSDTNLKVELPVTLRGMVTLRVEDGANRTEPVSFRVLGPVITDIKRVRNEAGAITNIRIFGLGVGRKARVTANGEELSTIKERFVPTRFGEQVVVTLPSRLRREESLELRVINDAGLESPPIMLPLKK